MVGTLNLQNIKSNKFVLLSASECEWITIKIYFHRLFKDVECYYLFMVRYITMSILNPLGHVLIEKGIRWYSRGSLKKYDC